MVFNESTAIFLLFIFHPAHVPSDYPLLVHKQSTGKGIPFNLFTTITFHLHMENKIPQINLSLVIHLFIAYLTKTIQDHFVTNSVMKTEEDLYLTLRQIPKIWSPLYHTEHLQQCFFAASSICECLRDSSGLFVSRNNIC